MRVSGLKTNYFENCVCVNAFENETEKNVLNCNRVKLCSKGVKPNQMKQLEDTWKRERTDFKWQRTELVNWIDTRNG